jgi:hypothetical protein
MVQPVETEAEIARLRGPALVAWLVANTERLVMVAAALDERALDLSPSVPRERVIELCQAIRHASLELTVALLSLLSKSDDHPGSVLADAVANAHARIQAIELASAAPAASSARPLSNFSAPVPQGEKRRNVATMGRRMKPMA